VQREQLELKEELELTARLAPPARPEKPVLKA